MVKRGMMACVALALLAACAQEEKADPFMEKPSATQMRSALKDLLVREPKYSIPEFELSVADSPAIHDRGMTRIGSFDCNADALTFEATFSAPNLTMQQLEGRFELDARHVWRAVVVRSAVTTARDTSVRRHWYHDEHSSWARPQQ